MYSTANALLDLGRKRFQFGGDVFDLKDDLAMTGRRKLRGSRTEIGGLAAQIGRVGGRRQTSGSVAFSE